MASQDRDSGLKSTSLRASWFTPQRVIQGFSIGVSVGILIVILQISFAAMIFSGDLSAYLGRGIGLTLFGAFMLGMVSAVFGPFAGGVSFPQDAPVAVLGIVAATIAAGMSSTAAPGEVYPTIVLTIAVSTAFTGLFLFLVGQFELGNLVRFVPYPVIGGFLAGIGCLLVQGGLGVILDTTVSAANLSVLIQSDMLVRWVPGMLFASLLLWTLQRYNHFLVMPTMLLAGILGFYIVLFLTGTPLSEASARGYLMGPFPKESLWNPITPTAWSQANWAVIFGQIGNLGTILIVGIMSLLLNASGLELAAKQDIDLNRELKSCGIANMVGALGGSPPGYVWLGVSALNNRMAPNSRWPGVFSALLCGVALFFGASFLSFFPKVIAGSLLLLVGLDFLMTWIYKSWFRLPKLDYLLVVTILVVIGFFGFLKGVGVGIIVSILIFIVKYSRVNVIKYVLSGRTYQSNAYRAVPFRWLLNQKGEQLCILKLQGFIFFGTANSLLNRIKHRADNPDMSPLKYLVIDFSQATGLDTSALNSFERLKQFAETRQITVVITALDEKLRSQFEAAGFSEPGETVCRFDADLDHGVEWCEERIIAAEQSAMDEERAGSAAGQRDILFDSTFDDMVKFLDQQDVFESLVSRMKPFLEIREIKQGEYLVQQDRDVCELYFIESGQVTTRVESKGGKAVRLRAMGAGAVIGEQCLFADASSPCSVVADEQSVVHVLSIEKLKEMEAVDQDLAADLFKYLAAFLGERLAAATRTIQALMET